MLFASWLAPQFVTIISVAIRDFFFADCDHPHAAAPLRFPPDVCLSCN